MPKYDLRFEGQFLGAGGEDIVRGYDGDMTIVKIPARGRFLDGFVPHRLAV